MKPFILASASPRRKQILSRIIDDFLVLPSPCEERADESLPPRGRVEQLARQKAAAVFALHPDCTVLGADTMVFFEGQALGKPKDGADAARTLEMLAGKEHIVLTGVCLMSGEKVLVRSAESRVRLCPLSGEQILSYVQSGSPLDKAGSYGIQDEGIAESFEGSYTNIVGLPEELVREMLQEL